MAVPALPAAKNTDDVIDNAWVDRVRALLADYRDDKPAFKGFSSTTLSRDEYQVNRVALTDNFPAGFFETPIVNVGGFTRSGSAYGGVIVPETGLYWVSAYAEMTGNGGVGDRQLFVYKNDVIIPGLLVRYDASSQTTTNLSTGAQLVFIDADDEIEIGTYHTAASALSAITGGISLQWAGSSDS